MGQRTDLLTTASTLATFLGHDDSGSLMQQPVANLATQLAGAGAIADALAAVPGSAEVGAIGDRVTAIEADYVADADLAVQTARIDTLESATAYAALLFGTWAELQAATGAGDGQRAEVDAGDTGTHAAATATGYDGAAVDNASAYRWDSSWSRWVRVGATGVAGLDTRMTAVETDKAPLLSPAFTGTATAESLVVRGAAVNGLRNVAANSALSESGAATSWQLSSGTVPTYEDLNSDVFSALSALHAPAPDRAIAFDAASGLTFAYKNETLTTADSGLYVLACAIEYSASASWSAIDAVVYSPSAGNLTGKTTGYVELSPNVRFYWVAGQLPASGLVRLAIGNSVIASGDGQLSGFGLYKSAMPITINQVRLYDHFPDVIGRDDIAASDHAALLAAQAAIASQAITIAELQAGATDEVLSRPVVFFGDSRVQFNNRRWHSATSTDWKGIPIGGYGWWSFDVTASATSGVGTLEYRASDGYMRVTLAGDTAGAWTPTYAGYVTLTSGNGTTTVTLPLLNTSGMPVTDQTIDLGSLTSRWRGYRADGALVRMMAQWGWPDVEPDVWGFGGGKESDFLEILPWLRAQMTVPSLVFYQGITNEISAGTDGATIISRMRQIFDTLKADGHEVLIVGNCARWGSAVSTPMTAGQITASETVRDWLLGQEGFIDLFPPTCDTANLSDLRPRAAILEDAVHFGRLGAQAVGKTGGAYLRRRYGRGARIAPADAGNVWAAGFPGNTSGGTTSGGATGTVPDGWSVELVSGTATVTATVEERADYPGEYMVNVDITATTAAWVLVSGAGASTTLAALGLSVGDDIRFRPVMHIKQAEGLDVVRPYVLFDGISPTTTLEALNCAISSNAANGFDTEGPVDLSTPSQFIPTGTLRTRPYFEVRVDAGGRAKVAFAAGISRL